jgi:hypothetical protein
MTPAKQKLARYPIARTEYSPIDLDGAAVEMALIHQKIRCHSSPSKLVSRGVVFD